MCCFCRFPEFSSDYHSLAQKETINSGYCDTVYLGTIVAVIINSLINLIMRKRAWIKMQMKMSKLQMDDKCGIFIYLFIATTSRWWKYYSKYYWKYCLSRGKNQRWKVGPRPDSSSVRLLRTTNQPTNQPTNQESH